jgi:hypothetical protein
MFAFKSRTATLAFAAALFFAATLTAPPPAYAADQPEIPTVHFHTVKVDGICSTRDISPWRTSSMSWRR